MNLIIRPCRRADLRVLEWSGAYRAHRLLIAGVFARTRWRQSAMLVATIGTEVIGQVWLDLARKPATAVLWALRVAPSWRNRGIGTILIAAAEREARAAGAGLVELEAENDTSQVRTLYDSLGYQCVGRAPAQDSITGTALGSEIDLFRRSLIPRSLAT